ncbi:MAG TPA: metallophosphoesterase [Planctomycetota bacterium]|nr:metallophosphoesterase [Planctomycetota bacterium]
MRTLRLCLLIIIAHFPLLSAAAERQCPPLLSLVSKDALTISVVLDKEDKDLTLTYADGKTIKPTKIEITDSRQLGPQVAIHKFRITGLKPGTSYPYKVMDFTSKFRTAPADQNTEVLFLFGGDYTMPQDPMVQKIEEQLKKEVDFFVDLGDHLFTRRVWIKDANWIGRTPILLALGNHDNEVPKYTKDPAQAQKYLDFPDPANLDFSFEWGPVMFRVEDVPGYSNPYSKEELDTIDKAYAATKCPWKFYACHHIFFSDGPHGYQSFPVNGKPYPEGVLRREQLWPIFKKHNVRVAFNGHDHSYQRSAFINGEGKPDPAGTMNVVYGGDVNDLKNKSLWSLRQYLGGKSSLAYLHVKGSEATLRLIERDGSVADELTFKLK